MKVSSTDWHMRLTRKVFSSNYKPKNLCQHFWATAGAAAFAISLGLISAAGVAVAGVAVYYVLRGLSAWFDVTVLSIVVAITIGVGTVAGVTGIVIVGMPVWKFLTDILIRLFDRLDKVLGARFGGRPKEPKPKKEKKPKVEGRESLLWAFLKAKKRKVCPPIDLVDDVATGRGAEGAD